MDQVVGQALALYARLMDEERRVAAAGGPSPALASPGG
jgi:hypothetical protein